MFGSKKNQQQKLNTQYRKLMDESFKLSKIDRKKSDLKLAEAEELRKKIDELNQSTG